MRELFEELYAEIDATGQEEKIQELTDIVQFVEDRTIDKINTVSGYLQFICF